MSDSFQSEVPKARINLKLDLHTGGASKKTELPLKLLVAGDFSHGQESAPLSERKKVNLNKNNFDSVLSEYSPNVNLTVRNTLAGDGSEENITLTFQSMKDFTPEQVSRQIPQLKAMLSMRNLLRDLKANLLDTEAVRKRPYSVVLLDEVEKAHRDVMNLFYQVFDRGFMRDGEGREIDFRNTVILMTSNLGSDPLMQLLDEQPEATESDLHELLRPILRDHFQPALLARFQTVIYRPLAEAAMRIIVEMKLDQVSKRLSRHYGLTTHIDVSLYDALTAACLLPDTGARNVDSLLNQQILPVLSQQLLTHMAAKQKPHTLTLGWSDEEGISLDFNRTEGENV